MTGPTSAGAYAGKLSRDELSAIVACPVCRAPLALPEAPETRCAECATSYRRLAHAWDLTPPRERWSSETWEAWEQLQENGDVSYREDPENNLGVGPRDDHLAFSSFAGLDGLVLDVGCGPQPWPTNFDRHAPGTRFVGVDPLVGTREAHYTQIRALAEFLPFADARFDHVLFATSLDHFVDPTEALREARRVVAADGSIDIWVGHKRADAPAPAESPAWYRTLVKPPAADDVFHFKRLDAQASEALFAAAGLRVAHTETHAVDEYRTNHFYKLSPA